LRLFDFVAAAVGLLLLSPLLAVVAILIVATSAGPVFHKAQRVGRGGQTFRLYKFRSMVAGADRIGPRITAAGDARITPVGRFLRRTKIDELPQLINVLKGEMSLVGPRPEDPRYVALYTAEQRQLLAVRPGITSPASLAYRDEESLLACDDWERTYVERVLPHKLAIELAYLARRNWVSDLGIVLRTVLAVLLPSPRRPQRHDPGISNLA
jgi:lipopolysaccharide/colanic/teichoic acid biosynthesis glycosyltransferase